jgi:hypothetical protein
MKGTVGVFVGPLIFEFPIVAAVFRRRPLQLYLHTYSH